MSEYYKIVYDETELKKFYDLILAKEPLLPNEVRYVSLSVRNKYITDEEREYYNCGRSEMFGKQVIRHDSYEAFKQAIYRYECNTQGYLTKNFVPYPQKAVVCYININPSDVLKTLSEMNVAIDENKDALVYAALKNSKEGVSEAFHKIRKVEDTMISLYARNLGTKVWCDFDFDIDKSYIPNILAVMEMFFAKIGSPLHYWVDTKGGAHMLFHKDYMKFNPSCICTAGLLAYWFFVEKEKSGKYKPFNILYDADNLKRLADTTEVILNKNQMIPCPGTLQANHEVKIVEYFTVLSSIMEEYPNVLETHVDVMVELFKKRFFVNTEKKETTE